MLPRRCWCIHVVIQRDQKMRSQHHSQCCSTCCCGSTPCSMHVMVRDDAPTRQLDHIITDDHNNLVACWRDHRCLTRILKTSIARGRLEGSSAPHMPSTRLRMPTRPTLFVHSSTPMLRCVIPLRASRQLARKNNPTCELLNLVFVARWIMIVDAVKTLA